MDSFFPRRVFGELPIAESALHVIVVISLLEMWLCAYKVLEVLLESLPLSPKRGREAVPFLFG
jgi:hypothetical protein